MTPGRKYKAIIEFKVPEQVSTREVQDFIEEWLTFGGGCRHPSDPLFNSLQKVRVGKIEECST